MLWRIVIALTALTGAACADEQVAHNCTCLSKEQIYAQGETTCIRGQRMRCGMNQNISTWETTGESCAISDLRDVNQSEPVTAM